VSGVISDGCIPFQHQIPAWAPERPEQTFKTTVFPVASAGAIFHETITYNSTGMSECRHAKLKKPTKGKFHGVMAP